MRLLGHYNGDGRWVFEGSSPARSLSVRWALIHLEDDHCIYRWGAIRIQTELGAAILFGPRRLEQVVSRQQRTRNP